MKPRIISIIFACLAIVLAAVSTPTSNAHAAAKKWRIQTALPAASMYMDIIKSFAANVDAMSGGRLKTEVLPVGAVVGFFDVQDAVDKGLVEGGFTWPHFFSGKKPAAYLFADQPSVGGMDQFTFLSWYYEGDGEKLYADFIKNDLKANMVGFINLMSGGQPLGWFKEPIKSLEDFRKLKYRSPPGITGELFNNMGVTTVSLPGGELVPAAQRGVIDAVSLGGFPAVQMKAGSLIKPEQFVAVDEKTFNRQTLNGEGRIVYTLVE